MSDTNTCAKCHQPKPKDHPWTMWWACSISMREQVKVCTDCVRAASPWGIY